MVPRTWKNLRPLDLLSSLALRLAVLSANRGQSEVGPHSRLSSSMSLLTQVGGLYTGAQTVVSGQGARWTSQGPTVGHALSVRFLIQSRDQYGFWGLEITHST